MKKFLIAVLLCMGLFSGLNVTEVYADAAYPVWTKDQQGWKLVYQDGSLYPGGWFYDVDTGLWYYMQNTGYVLTDAVSPDGFSVSASGRVLEPRELTMRLYQDEVWEYLNTAFRFKILLPERWNKSYIGAQNENETNDVDIEGGVQFEFYPGYKLDVYGSVYTPGEPNYRETEEFITYSGLKGKIYTDRNNGKIYLKAQIYGNGGVVSANVIGGIPEEESDLAKIAFRKALRGISVLK